MFRNVWLRNLRTRTCCRIDRSRTSASMCADCQERYVGWDVDNSGKFAKIDSICEQLKNDVGVIIRLHEGIRVRIRMRQEMLHGCPNLCWKAIPKEASILCPECPTTEEEKKRRHGGRVVASGCRPVQSWRYRWRPFSSIGRARTYEAMPLCHKFRRVTSHLREFSEILCRISEYLKINFDGIFLFFSRDVLKGKF